MFTCLELTVNFFVEQQNALCKSPLTSLSNDLYSVLDNQKALRTLSRPLHSKFKKVQRLFKDLHGNLRTFEGKMDFESANHAARVVNGLTSPTFQAVSVG